MASSTWCVPRSVAHKMDHVPRRGYFTQKWSLSPLSHPFPFLPPWILSSCLFIFYAEYITRHAGLEEAQAGIKIAGRNINNLRYADDTTFMAESEEELKSLLMKVKEESEKLA